MRVSALSRRVAVAAAGIALVGAGTLPAVASPHHAAVPATKVFTSKLTPSKNVKPGTKLTVTSTKAAKSTSYLCLLVILKGSDYAADLSSNVPSMSNSKGHITCHITFPKGGFSATDLQGKTHTCPLSKKDAKSGWKCGVSLATATKSSASINYFTAK